CPRQPRSLARTSPARRQSRRPPVSQFHRSTKARLLLSRRTGEPLYGGSLTPLSDVTISFYPAPITKLSRAASTTARVATRRSLISIRRATFSPSPVAGIEQYDLVLCFGKRRPVRDSGVPFLPWIRVSCSKPWDTVESDRYPAS